MGASPENQGLSYDNEKPFNIQTLYKKRVLTPVITLDECNSWCSVGTLSEVEKIDDGAWFKAVGLD